MLQGEFGVLVDNDALKSLKIVPHPSGSGYKLLINGKPLTTQRKAERRFATVDSAGAFLSQHGLNKAAVVFKE
ncbi:MAG: hypothetical protein V7699_06995 [Porticoccus sp.]